MQVRGHVVENKWGKGGPDIPRKGDVGMCCGMWKFAGECGNLMGDVEICWEMWKFAGGCGNLMGNGGDVSGEGADTARSTLPGKVRTAAKPHRGCGGPNPSGYAVGYREQYKQNRPLPPGKSIPMNLPCIFRWWEGRQS